MGVIEIAILAVILLYSVWVIKRKIQSIKEGNGCGCGCSSCSKDCGLGKKDDN